MPSELRWGWRQRLGWHLRHFLRHRPNRTPVLSKSLPVVVAGMFRTGNGIGQSARGCFEALEAAGVNPVAVCTSGWLDQVDMDAYVDLGRMPDDHEGILILHANPPETELLLYQLGLNRFKSWTVTGYWAWELPVLPEHWSHSARQLSEIWVPSQFVEDAVSRDVDIDVRNIPLKASSSFEANGKATPTSAIHVLVMADGRSSFERKNVKDAIEVFQRAFTGDAEARLTLKCRNLSEAGDSARQIAMSAEGDERIQLIDETLHRNELLSLMAKCDVLLSCHRSEGFGLHLAEAMVMGKCVLATGWSGNLDFMTPENSVLLPYDLVPVEDPDGIYQAHPKAKWAQIRVEEAAELLRNIAEDVDKRRRLGDAARRITTRLDGSAFVGALAQVYKD